MEILLVGTHYCSIINTKEKVFNKLYFKEISYRKGENKLCLLNYA